VCVVTFSSSAFAFLIKMPMNFKSLFAIWSSSLQRVYYYFYLSKVEVSWQYQKYSTILILVLCFLCVTPLVEIMLFIGKPMRRSIMISNATNPFKESRKESLLRCAGSTSICVWLVCDLVVMCVQVVGDRVLGDLCVCVRCGSVQSQKV